MLGFNWVDLIVLILLASAVYAGVKVGALGLLTVVGGFFAALLIGGWLYPKLLPIDDRALRTVVNTNLVLITAVLAGSFAFKLNEKMHHELDSPKWKKTDTIAGGAVGFMSMGVLVWLLLSTVVRLPFVGLSNHVHGALSTQMIRNLLPRAPAVFATFNNHINPNNPPFLFYDRASEADFAYSKKTYDKVVNASADSVVAITGLGCGGVISGTGFVAEGGLILTSAHVVAGLDRPIVKYEDHSFEATPIWFDSSLDFAVLKVNGSAQGFDAPALKLMGEALADDTTVGVIGFADGKFTAVPGIVHESLHIFGRNIYDAGYIGRDVYVVQTNAAEGMSGGPVIAPDGRVAGIIFSKFYHRGDLAYALASPRLNSLLQQLDSSKKRVGLGVCVAG